MRRSTTIKSGNALRFGNALQESPSVEWTSHPIRLGKGYRLGIAKHDEEPIPYARIAKGRQTVTEIRLDKAALNVLAFALASIGLPAGNAPQLLTRLIQAAKTSGLA